MYSARYNLLIYLISERSYSLPNLFKFSRDTLYSCIGSVGTYAVNLVFLNGWYFENFKFVMTLFSHSEYFRHKPPQIETYHPLVWKIRIFITRLSFYLRLFNIESLIMIETR